MKLLENLKWRYATKKFDTSLEVSEMNLNYLFQVINLSASSFGLQPLKVLNIVNKEIRQKLKEKSWNQSQIVDASHLLIIANYTEVNPSMINEFIKEKSRIQSVPIEGLQDYGKFMIAKIAEKSQEEIKNWTAKQAYIVLGNLLTACAELKIDSCPIEGFEIDAYNEILELHKNKLSAAVVIAIGYRSDEDSNQLLPKVRKGVNKIVETIL